MVSLYKRLAAMRKLDTTRVYPSGFIPFSENFYGSIARNAFVIMSAGNKIFAYLLTIPVPLRHPSKAGKIAGAKNHTTSTMILLISVTGVIVPLQSCNCFQVSSSERFLSPGSYRSSSSTGSSSLSLPTMESATRQICKRLSSAALHTSHGSF